VLESEDRRSRRRLTITPAPEPSEVNWENLELDRWYEYKAQALTYGASAALIFGVMGLSTWTKSEDILTVTVAGVPVQVGYYLCVAVANPMLKQLITFFSAKEGLDTRTEVERSLFTKLSMTLVFNTVVIPMLVALWQSTIRNGTLGIDQAWYENGGIIDGFVVLCVSNVAVDGILQLVQYPTLLNRYVFAKFYVSTYKLSQLWLPPVFPVGYLHAVALKTLALCLLYAPLYPLAYPFTAAALIFVYWFTKFALAHWYRRPPTIDGRMLAQLRMGIAANILMHIVVMFFGAVSSAPPDGKAVPVIGALVSLVIWWVICGDLFLPWEGYLPCMPRWLRTPPDDPDDLDTDGVAYSDVAKQKEYEIERYECPAVTEKAQMERVSEEVFRKTEARLVVEKWMRRVGVEQAESKA